MKVMVTGSAGQLGHDILKRLAELRIEAKGVDYQDFDLTDAQAVMDAVCDYRPDAIVHCAAYTAVDRAEQELLDLGFHQVRVRIHGDSLARIEVLPAEFPQLLDNAQRLVRDFKALGFSYVTMDLAGYRTGSMNETLEGDDAK